MKLFTQTSCLLKPELKLCNFCCFTEAENSPLMVSYIEKSELQSCSEVKTFAFKSDYNSNLTITNCGQSELWTICAAHVVLYCAVVFD